jgi:hypothetical protein
MREKVIRAVTTFGFLAVITIGALALMGGPAEAKGKKTPCPWPPCMAPCVFGVEPTVRCFSPGGPPVETTFACCCCGGGSRGTRYQPI